MPMNLLLVVFLLFRVFLAGDFTNARRPQEDSQDVLATLPAFVALVRHYLPSGSIWNQMLEAEVPLDDEFAGEEATLHVNFTQVRREIIDALRVDHGTQLEPFSNLHPLLLGMDLL